MFSIDSRYNTDKVLHFPVKIRESEARTEMLYGASLKYMRLG